MNETPLPIPCQPTKTDDCGVRPHHPTNLLQGLIRSDRNHGPSSTWTTFHWTRYTPPLIASHDNPRVSSIWSPFCPRRREGVKFILHGKPAGFSHLPFLLFAVFHEQATRAGLFLSLSPRACRLRWRVPVPGFPCSIRLQAHSSPHARQTMTPPS